MRPIEWNEDEVRLECPSCGALTNMGSRAYFWALGRGIEVTCPTCREASPVEDRRRAPETVENERRAAGLG